MRGAGDEGKWIIVVHDYGSDETCLGCRPEEECESKCLSLCEVEELAAVAECSMPRWSVKGHIPQTKASATRVKWARRK